MDRKLAHIEKIVSITPIDGADKVELAIILGWQCMVSKSDNYKVGDLVIYCEVDSIMPEMPEYEFLRKYEFRVNTQKYFKGKVISQGLILPLNQYLENTKYNEGDDVTRELGITKYLSKSEQEENNIISSKHWTKKFKLTAWMWRYSWFRRFILLNKSKQDWPSWVSHTDEERIQNIPKILEQFANKEVYVTEKIDYQSVTFTGKLTPKFKWLGKLSPMKYKFIVCSRNHVTNDKNSLYWKIAERYNIEQILKKNPTLTIQGEQGDTKVQGNKYGIAKPTMWVFNIIDHEKNYHFNYYEMEAFCTKYNLKIVPLLSINNFNDEGNVIGTMKLSELGLTVQELIEFSKGKSVINPNIEREGIVVRCIENGKKLLSFKVINPNFLIQHNL